MAFVRRFTTILTRTRLNIPFNTQGKCYSAEKKIFVLWVFYTVCNVYIFNNLGRKIHRWVSPTLIELKYREKKQGGKVVNPRNQFLEWNLEAELYAFGKRLNEEFDSELLLQAFTDRSYVIKEEMKQKEMELDIKMKDNRELAEQGNT